MQYTHGIFSKYEKENNLDLWNGFSELMLALGFQMDCCHSFDEYQTNCGLVLKEASSERDRKRNILYILEHADRQIVGNYLFSMWRYYTHWSYGYNFYDVDFLRRIIAILKTKYE